MVYFRTPAACDVAKKYGIAAAKLYTIDGMDIWGVDVPKEHPLLKDPEFIGHLLDEKMKSGTLVLRRLQPPLYTVHAYVPHADSIALVLGREKAVLRHMLTNPKTGTCPKITLLRSGHEVTDTLRYAARDHAEYILLFINKEYAEVMPLKDSLALICIARRKKIHGRTRSTTQ